MFIRVALIIFCLSISSVESTAQVLINYLDSNNESLTSEDLNVCGGDSINQAHFVVFDDIENFEVEIEYPPTVVPPSNTDYQITVENGTSFNVTSVSLPDTDNRVRISFNPTSLVAGDNFILQWKRSATCESIDEYNSGTLFKDKVYAYDGNSLIQEESSEFQNAYEVLSARIGIGVISPLDVNLGESYSQTFEISNNGTGSIEQFEFSIEDFAGI